VCWSRIPTDATGIGRAFDIISIFFAPPSAKDTEMSPGANAMKRLVNASFCAAFGGGLTLLLGQTAAVASGFAVPELSTAGIGTANALVANPAEIGAFPYNPAAMGFHAASSLAIGGSLINPTFTLDNAAGSHNSRGADWVGTPTFQAAFKLNDKWRIGLGIDAPFGLETRWRLGTFPALSGTTLVTVPRIGPVPIPNGNPPTESKLEIFDFVPTASYRINENSSAAAGLDVYWAKSAVLNSTLADVNGTGTGVGFNLSLLYRRDAWSMGASFHSAATVGIDGSYTPLNPTLVALGALRPAQGADLDLDLPWRLQLGIRYAINPALAVELDWTRTGWSQFDQLQARAQGTGAVLFTDTNAWTDANAYRFALTYAIRPTTELRVGYSYDQTGQGDDRFSARVPDSHRHLFGVGVAQKMGNGYTVEAGYMYVRFNERNYIGTHVYTGLGSDLNGSDALAGTYTASANLVGLELTKTF
jgi:long-chain fatty acid transport protein